MHKISTEICKIIEENIARYLPHVTSGDLEKDGAIFYMNGNNGTEFDWYVNDRLPSFMVFYDDKENMGAAKLLLSCHGEVELYLYGEQGKKLVQEVHTHLEADEGELLAYAAMLKTAADDNRIWGGDLAELDTCTPVDPALLEAFRAQEENYSAMKNRRDILNLFAIVSKKITQEGWKVGYMERSDPHNSNDSGWFYAAGIEEEDYFSNPENMELVCVGNVWQELDPDIFQHIDMPIGSRLIRVSEKEFEPDQNNKAICAVRR